MENGHVVLGAGITGLAAGIASGARVFEANESPGGICSSYYLRPAGRERLSQSPDDEEAYRFDTGGGHWIFGGDPAVLRFIHSMSPVNSYARRSSVYFHSRDLYVPYPLQNHLGYLGKKTAATVLNEIAFGHRMAPATMNEWLEQSFGKTLTEIFFKPFHELYTAGLWTRIAPQDGFKSPVSFPLALQGAFEEVPPVGYNVTFVYPVQGLNTLVRRMMERCSVRFNKKAVRIEPRCREIHFADGSSDRYRSLISTLPLNRMVEMTGLGIGAQPDPYTSVLVLNIGAVRGPRCPDDHWLYIPASRSGFHRVGFYSNVDVSFLPASSRADNSRVSIYVERSFAGGMKPSEEETEAYKEEVIRELQEWQFIEDVDVADPTWIDEAYTWAWPRSGWRQMALKLLEEQDIYQVGRYARWSFQGIADSIRDGFLVGTSLKNV